MSHTFEIGAAVDVSAAVFAARASHDSWFCMEHPDRDGHAIAGVGVAARVMTMGPDRFRDAAAQCRGFAQMIDCGDDLVGLPSGAGPVFCGGFAFADAGGHSSEWATFHPGLLVLPEVSILRRAGRAWLTLAIAVRTRGPGPGAADPSYYLGQLEKRLESIQPATMPLIDPHPVQPAHVAGASPPEHYEGAVNRAVELIRRGELQKVVLAREVRVDAAQPFDAAAVFGALRDVFPSCFTYCVGNGERAFIGASPELLVRRDGARAQTVALAGTTRRSADPSVDDHLGEQLLHSTKEREEQAIVAARIERTLKPVSVWVAAADEPVLVKVQNVQHL
ncbi:MAG TPA: chorismate-binding protein, partial [Thermoleophilaceae bacterium]